MRIKNDKESSREKQILIDQTLEALVKTININTIKYFCPESRLFWKRSSYGITKRKFIRYQNGRPTSHLPTGYFNGYKSRKQPFLFNYPKIWIFWISGFEVFVSLCQFHFESGNLWSIFSTRPQLLPLLQVTPFFSLWCENKNKNYQNRTWEKGYPILVLLTLLWHHLLTLWFSLIERHRKVLKTLKDYWEKTVRNFKNPA